MRVSEAVLRRYPISRTESTSLEFKRINYTGGHFVSWCSKMNRTTFPNAENLFEKLYSSLRTLHLIIFITFSHSISVNNNVNL